MNPMQPFSASKLFSWINPTLHEMDLNEFQTLCKKLTEMEEEFKNLSGAMPLKMSRNHNGRRFTGYPMQHRRLGVPDMEFPDIEDLDSYGCLNSLHEIMTKADALSFFHKIYDWHSDVEEFHINHRISINDKNILKHKFKDFTKMVHYELFKFNRPKNIDVFFDPFAYKKYPYSLLPKKGTQSRIAEQVSENEKHRIKCVTTLRRRVESRLLTAKSFCISPDININEIQDSSLQRYRATLSLLSEEFKNAFLTNDILRKSSITRQKTSRDKLLQARRRMKEELNGTDKGGLEDMSSLAEALKTCKEPRPQHKARNFIEKFSRTCDEIEMFYLDFAHPIQVRNLIRTEFIKCLEVINIHLSTILPPQESAASRSGVKECRHYSDFRFNHLEMPVARLLREVTRNTRLLEAKMRKLMIKVERSDNAEI